MSYRPRKLNFTVWLATTGCGVSRKIIDKDHSTLGLTLYAYNFYLLHVYFTVMRILFQMGGIQSISALSGDPTFNQFNNSYDVAHTKEYMLNSEWIRQVISITLAARITDLGASYLCLKCWTGKKILLITRDPISALTISVEQQR